MQLITKFTFKKCLQDGRFLNVIVWKHTHAFVTVFWFQLKTDVQSFLQETSHKICYFCRDFRSVTEFAKDLGQSWLCLPTLVLVLRYADKLGAKAKETDHSKFPNYTSLNLRSLIKNLFQDTWISISQSTIWIMTGYFYAIPPERKI